VASLKNELLNTRQGLGEICYDLNIDVETVDTNKLGIYQCCGCGLWQTKLFPDLDGTPICRFCLELIGM
jgi:hypothetical protein